MSHETIKSISEAYILMVTERLLNERYSMDNKPTTKREGGETLTVYNVYYKDKKIGSVVKIDNNNYASGGNLDNRDNDEYFSDNHKTPEAAYKAFIKQKPHKTTR